MWSQSRGYVALASSVIIMVLSGVVNQVVFIDEHYPKPLLVSLVCNVMFSFGVLQKAGKKRREGDIEDMDYPEETIEVGKPREKETFFEAWIWNKEMKAALPFSFLFFVSNYLFNISLEYTTVSSTTAIGTTTAVWCLVFSYIFKLEPLTIPKVSGLTLCILGTILISVEDLKSLSYAPSTLPLVGDFLSLLSAILYALYTVLLSFLPKEVKMFRFLGYMGLSSFFYFFPLLALAQITGFETLQWPSFPVFLSLILNGIIGTLLTQYLFSIAILWTSPLIAGVGCTLTIPVAEVFDLFFRGMELDKGHSAAMALMMGGFLVVTWEKSRGKTKLEHN